jgi:hypothetical protein
MAVVTIALTSKAEVAMTAVAVTADGADVIAM